MGLLKRTSWEEDNMCKRHLGILAVTLLLTACGGGGTEPPKSTEGAAPAAAKSSQGPVLSHPASIKTGERFVVMLSKQTSGELVVWHNGKIAGKETFTNTDKPSITLTELGDNGIEVWYDDPDATKRSVIAVFVKVEK